MSLEIQFITDNKNYFIKNTEDNWSGEKGKIYDINCWQVLQEIQQSYGYQTKCLLRMKIDELQKII